MAQFFSLLYMFQEPQAAPSGPGTGFFMIQMFAIFAIIYFLMIRPKAKEERKHRERLQELKPGDRVVTAGGVMGDIVHIKEEKVTIKSGESKLVVLRSRIAEIPSMAEPDKK
ncbi:MAG: preprotein translocase subunit YajC [Gemmatimonadota bacterium]|nr:preprotein translocase subunit YajC [Gemmatimonadota bacterium]